jgi:hypothetical protein
VLYSRLLLVGTHKYKIHACGESNHGCRKKTTEVNVDFRADDLTVSELLVPSSRAKTRHFGDVADSEW